MGESEQNAVCTCVQLSKSQINENMIKQRAREDLLSTFSTHTWVCTPVYFNNNTHTHISNKSCVYYCSPACTWYCVPCLIHSRGSMEVYHTNRWMRNEPKKATGQGTEGLIGPGIAFSPPPHPQPGWCPWGPNQSLIAGGWAPAPTCAV